MGETLTLAPGAEVKFAGEYCVISAPSSGAAYVLLRPDRTYVTATVEEIVAANARGLPQEEAVAKQDHFTTVPAEKLMLATTNYAAISHLARKPDRSLADVDAAAVKLGVNRRTVHRMLSKLSVNDSPMALIRTNRGVVIGTSRLDARRDDLIDKTIKSVYLTEQRHTVQDVYDAVRRACYQDRLKAPCYNTIARRICNLDQELVVAKRLGAKEARRRFRPHPGKFPGADYPGAVVQIDHTTADMALLIGEGRDVTYRPSITVAVDQFTKMIVSIVVSPDPVSRQSTGTCIANAILPKEAYLKRLGLRGDEWPSIGVMTTILTDNGADFWSDDLENVCKAYGINHAISPVGEPHYRGTIERAIKTIMKQIHKLPGTTFSNPRERGDYDSAGHAVFTLDEFERALVIWITSVHHEQVHRGISCSPRRMFEKAALGVDGLPPTWYRKVRTDERRVRIDFLPSFRATVQQHGVVRKHLWYWHDVLRSHLGEKLDFKVDFRCVSPIYYLDPEQKEYVDIHFSDVRQSPISEYERRAAAKRARDENSPVNERTIFAAQDELQSICERSTAATKTAKRKRMASERARVRRKAQTESWRTCATTSRPVEDVATEPANSNVLMFPQSATADMRPYDGDGFG